MVEISLKDDLFRRASAGTQPKWHIGNTWYKADDVNYEGLAESITSDMLHKSNITEIAAIASYDPELIRYKRKLLTGCRSENFRPENSRLIESSKLLDIHGRNKSVKDPMEFFQNPELAIREFVSAVQDVTHLDKFGQYIALMFQFDEVVLNPDRHFGNICVMQSGGDYSLSPFFDHGRSFALDADGWAFGKSIEKIAGSVSARPFCESFAKQAKIAKDLAGACHCRSTMGRTICESRWTGVRMYMMIGYCTGQNKWSPFRCKGAKTISLMGISKCDWKNWLPT